MSASNSEEMQVDVNQAMQAFDDMADSLRMEMGVATEEVEHPVKAALQAQIASGLTSDQLIAAAAVVKTIAEGRMLIMQSSDGTQKQNMMYKEGRWYGHDINRTEPANPPSFQYTPETFPVPNETLKMLPMKKSRDAAMQTHREEKLPGRTEEGSSRSLREVVRPKEKPAKMMTPHSFVEQDSETGQTSSSESPKPPPFIDEEKEAEEEARMLEEARQAREREEAQRLERERRAREEERREEVLRSEDRFRRETQISTDPATSIASTTESEVASDPAERMEERSQSEMERSGSASATSRGTSVEEPVERRMETDAETPAKYKIPKKSTATKREHTGSFREAMMSMDAPTTVEGPSESGPSGTRKESEVRTKNVEGQFEKDLNQQWKMVNDERNPARRPWRWTLSEAERKDWIRAKAVQPEYAKPREARRRIMVVDVDKQDLPPYVSQKWLRSLNQPGCEEFYPLVANASHDSQMPHRFNKDTHKEYPIGLKATKIISPKDLNQSRVCIMIDSTVKNGRPFHCLLYDVLCFPLPCATMDQLYAAFQEFYGVREPLASDEAKKRIPKHLVISGVIDHLAQKNLLKGILKNDEATCGRAVRELIRVMRGIDRACEDNGLHVSFIGPPGFQSWPLALQVVMLCVKEAVRKIGVYFSYGLCNIPVHAETLRLHEVSYPAFFATMSRLVQNHPRALVAKTGIRESLNLTVDDVMCYSHGVDAVIRAEVIKNGEITIDEHEHLQQEFALEKGSDENATVTKNIHDKVREGFERLRSLPRVDSAVPNNGFPEVKPNLTEAPAVGIKYIKESMKELVGHMVKGGYSQNEFEMLTTESLNRFCERRGDVELKQLVHEIDRKSVV